MNYPQIAAAELFETHADRLFLYCWSMLRSRGTAQVVLHDTLIAAPADATGSRLYSLARAACGQHRPVPAADADEPPVCFGRNDAGHRLVAWNAAMSLEPAEFEALELSTRHEVDLGQVLGQPASQVEALLARARQQLERALGAEVLARRGRRGTRARTRRRPPRLRRHRPRRRRRLRRTPRPRTRRGHSGPKLER